MHTASPPDTTSIPSSIRWTYLDDDLAVASETINPEARDVLLPQATRTRETRSFTVLDLGGVTLVLHRFPPDGIDNDLAEYVASELVRPEIVTVSDAFERLFAGVVESCAGSPEAAWRMFYANTLAGLERVAAGDYKEDDFGPVTVFGRVYSRARSLAVGSSLLDVGTCFGFFPLLLKGTAPHTSVTALDVSAPVLDLARRFALSSPCTEDIEFVRGDACGLPFPDCSFDTVTSLHVLEHLAEADARRAVVEMCRVARRRVVVAVPMEKEADAAFDHERVFDRGSLVALAEGAGGGWSNRFEEFLGGWLVLERAGGAVS